MRWARAWTSVTLFVVDVYVGDGDHVLELVSSLDLSLDAVIVHLLCQKPLGRAEPLRKKKC